MSRIVYVEGCDPGLVDTGLMFYRFDTANCGIEVHPQVVTRGTAVDIRDFVYAQVGPVQSDLFIEAYRPRGGMNTNQAMTLLVNEIAKECGSLQGVRHKVLPNTGIKKVVKDGLLELLVSRPQDLRHIKTNHGDLVSAARIAVLGMLKDPQLNELLTRIVKDHLNGSTWRTRLV